MERVSFKAIERVLGVSLVSVINWLKRLATGINFVRLEQKTVDIVEVNELHSYVGQKIVHESGLLLTDIRESRLVLASAREASEPA